MQGPGGFNNQLGNVLTLRSLRDNVFLLSTPILLLEPENISMGYRFLQTIVFEAKYLLEYLIIHLFQACLLYRISVVFM